MSAADAWAAGDHAGIGGWWSSRDDDPWHAVHWFSLQFSTEDLRRWAPLRGDLQKEIAWLELIAQVALLMLKCKFEEGPRPGSSSVQWCDNAATVGACKFCLHPYSLRFSWLLLSSGGKLLSTATPMAVGLQALAYWSHSCDHEVWIAL